jgi:hypothetical protein
VSVERAKAELAKARRFVARIADLIAAAVRRKFVVPARI